LGLSSLDCGDVLRFLGVRKAFGKDLKGFCMSLFYWIGGIVAVGLLIYLVVALLKPEIFS